MLKKLVLKMLKLSFHKLMNKMYISVVIAVLFSCKSPSQENNKLAAEKTVKTLTTSFGKEDEISFLENFPEDFETFKKTFGWDDQKDRPQPLYKNANSYIDYWFSLIQKAEYRKYEDRIIGISKGASWQADAIGYFQTRAVNYIIANKRYILINSLSDRDAESVLLFLINRHSQGRADFTAHLDKSKQDIINKNLSENISDQKKRGTFETYLNNKSFFIRTFDINKDGIADKVVSSIAYQGDDLFVFFGNKAGGYSEVLETTNFSEDGGNVIKDVGEIPGSKGFVVKTYFPDRGYYEKEFYITPENDTWILKNAIYRTMSDVSGNAVKYICDVLQNIDITKSGWSEKLQSIPDENERNKKCRTENVKNSVREYVVQDPDGYTNLRKEGNTSSRILQKITSGESVTVVERSGDWILVKTKQGISGYIHKSRITAR